MAGPARERRTREFLVHDEGTQTRYELADGELVAMNPPAEPHVRIGMNVYDALARQLRRPCRAYRRWKRCSSCGKTNRRVEVRERDGARWVLRNVIGSGAVRPEALGIELGLDEIYAD